MTLDALIDELLTRGADDWVTAAEVAWIARSSGRAPTDAEVSQLSLDLIRSMLMAGLMQAGDVTDGGFFEWDLPPKHSVDRIREAWERLGSLPNIGEVCWLANTAAGERRAEAAISRREKDSRR